jgi:hypothetical protein
LLLEDHRTGYKIRYKVRFRKRFRMENRRNKGAIRVKRIPMEILYSGGMGNEK